MKLLVDGSVRQPITVAVGVVLALLAGIVAFTRVPIQLAPQVDSTVVTVRTSWPNATPEEIESDIVEEQEDVLADIDSLTSMISTARTGSAEIRLEFRTGVDIEQAVAAVDQKLAQVPFYPEGVSNPEIENQDPQSIDYIAWVGLSCSDPRFDPYTLGDFMERILRPRFERLPGIAEVGVRGIRRSELLLTIDEVALAQRGIGWDQLVAVLRANNQDASGGALADGKRDVRLISTGRFRDPEALQSLVLHKDEEGIVRLRDVASVRIDYTEPQAFVRIRGVQMPVFNFQLSRGANLLDTMTRLKGEFATLNAPGGLLDRHARTLGLDGSLTLIQVYDASAYVTEAIDLVQGNILVGGALAVLVLLLFLRSWRSIAIIGLSIPISVIASVALLTAMGRTVNLISLAGFAFSVGLVVDNTIVVLENIYRHLERGKPPRRAARDGAAEVAGAVFASTLTTLVVFLPVLMIQETAGQLFRDIALAIMAAVGLSLIVSLTVIPAAASRLLKPSKRVATPTDDGLVRVGGFAGRVGSTVSWLGGNWLRRITTVLVFTALTVMGILWLKPPLDYLPAGNRNLAFGMVFAPPGYSVEQLSGVADRIQDRMRPYWEATEDKFPAETVLRRGERPTGDRRHEVPLGRHTMPGGPTTVTPPPVEHYFLGSFNGLIFHGAVSADAKRAVDLVPLLEWAAAPEVATDMFGFGVQPPIFRTGGTTGSAISINLSGDDLERIADAGRALFFRLMGEYGPGSARPTPSNFLLRTPQLRVSPDDERLQDAGLDRRSLGYALQAGGDGIRLVKSFADGAELKDVRIVSTQALSDQALDRLGQLPVATPASGIVDLGSLADLRYERVAEEILRVDRARAVTIELTPPKGIPLEQAIAKVDRVVEELRSSGAIPPDIAITKTGSAGNLAAIKEALAGDGSVVGLIASSLFLALLVVYLVMVVLFQSWLQPLVIMVSVPLATFGGFLGLGLLHWYSLGDRYTPVINLDVLTLLGFVILAGVVVNNAILIVSQALNLRREHPDLPIATIVGEATASRVRPIAMSMTTSIGGMLPLVLMPGSGSELYRGLAAVMVGGLALSTIFTLFLVPVLLEVVLGLKQAVGIDDEGPGQDSGGSRSTAAVTVLLSGGLLLGGCAVGPDYRGPPSDPLGDYAWSLPEGHGVTVAEHERWWRGFADPQLDGLIAAGLTANRDLAASLARLEASREALIAISGRIWPEVTAIADAERQRTSGELSESRSPGGGASSNRFELGLAASWEIDLWGRLHRAVEAGRAELGVALAELDGLAVSLRAGIASSYVQLRELQARYASAEAQAGILGETVALADARLAAGLSTQLDLAQVRGLHQQVLASLPALARQRDAMASQLALLLGRRPDQLPAGLHEPAPIPHPAAELLISLPADLLRRRPDIRLAERALAAQTARVGIATTDLYPRLSLRGSFGWAAGRTADLFTGPSRFWTLGADIQATIFDRGRLKALVRREQALVDAALAEWEQAVLVAVKDCQDALDAIAHEDQRLARLDAAVAAQTEATGLARDAYEAGLTDFQRVLDTRRELILIEDQQLAARAARSLALIDLYRAMGGAWELVEEDQAGARTH